MALKRLFQGIQYEIYFGKAIGDKRLLIIGIYIYQKYTSFQQWLLRELWRGYHVVNEVKSNNDSDKERVRARSKHNGEYEK